MGYEAGSYICASFPSMANPFLWKKFCCWIYGDKRIRSFKFVLYDACRVKTTSVFKIQWIIKRLSFSVQHFPPCTKGKSRIQQLPINLACHASNLLNSNAPVIRPTCHASHVPSHFQETHFDGANKNSFIYSTLTKKASLNDCSSFRNFYNEQSTFPYIYISRYH